MLVKDLIAQLLKYPADASVQIYDECDRFDFDLDHNEYSNQLDLNKFEQRQLEPREIAFVASCKSCGDYDLLDVEKYLLTPDCPYFQGYTQIADAWHFWTDAIEYANNLKETACADTQSTTPANLPSTCSCQDTPLKA